MAINSISIFTNNYDYNITLIHCLQSFNFQTADYLREELKISMLKHNRLFKKNNTIKIQER